MESPSTKDYSKRQCLSSTDNFVCQSWMYFNTNPDIKWSMCIVIFPAALLSFTRIYLETFYLNQFLLRFYSVQWRVLLLIFKNESVLYDSLIHISSHSSFEGITKHYDNKNNYLRQISQLRESWNMFFLLLFQNCSLYHQFAKTNSLLYQSLPELKCSSFGVQPHRNWIWWGST